jgi:hypothetical protein
MTRLALDGAQTVLGLGVIGVLGMYRESAPSLSELRDCDTSGPEHYRMRQGILDADLFGAIAVILIGGGCVMLTGEWAPFLFAAVGVVMVSTFYRSVLNSAPAGRVETI